ncbi:MAG TPA: aminotransferase class I/II-fold pyridoxal phosphate-dependent enzyme [Planctomycetota bacterium]|nr:aminotransferase class I/II-fold pyridoxal phosphate-dependent enzyme [Planctomycetota bacterium]
MPKKKKKSAPPYSLSSLLIHGQSKDKHWDYRHHVVPPMSSSTSYRLDSAARGARGFAEFGVGPVDPEDVQKSPIYIYDRLAEPTRDMLEEALATAERGEIAVTFASGMAAIAAALGICVVTGQHIVAHRVLYGSTYSLLSSWLPKYKITTTLTNVNSVEELRQAIRRETRVVYFETPANPNLELIDMAQVKRVVDTVNKRRKADDQIRILVDNTFASPFCQRPIEHGADLVIHSLTKGICGFGTDMGGAVIGARSFLPLLLSYRKDFGGVLSPKAAWPILVYGLSTLALRVKRQEETALTVSEFLAQHPKVKAVHYPGLLSFPQHQLARRQMTDYHGNFAPGSLVYFILKGSHSASRRLAERLIDRIARESYTITLAVSLGQVRTLIEHPSSMTHSSVPLARQIEEGIDPGGVRLSIGLEDSGDLIRDLARALSRV